MSPLRVEVYNADPATWIEVGKLNFSDPPGSISQNLPEGEREIYLFKCEGEDESAIYRSILGTDTADPQLRVLSTFGLEEVVRLKDGESHTLSIKTDVSDERRIVRFTHQR